MNNIDDNFELEENIQQKLKKSLINQLKENIKNLKLVVLSLSSFIIILLVTNIYFLSNKEYFIISPGGCVDKLISKELEISMKQIYTFVDLGIISTFTYSYINLDNHFMKISSFFSDNGFNNIKNAFMNANIFKYVEKYKVSQNIVPTNTVSLKEITGNNTMIIWRSYAKEEIRDTGRKLYEVIYQINIRKVNEDKYFYDLCIDNIKEIPIEEFKKIKNIE